MNLASLLDDSALRYPDRVALEHRRRAVTFTQLQRASVRVAGHLARAGVEPGDRVGLVLPNVPEFAAAYYGILRAGAIVVPLSPQCTRAEVASAMADAGARLALAWREQAWLARPQPLGATVALSVAPGSFYDIPQAPPALGQLAARDASDTAAILYTSGSAGEPKGVELTHANLALNARATVSLFSFEPSDTLLGALPLFHCFGQTCVLNAAMAAGACVRLIDRFDPGHVRRVLCNRRVSVFVGVPSMFASLAAARGLPAAASSRLRLCVSGGAPLGDDARRAFERRFGCAILEGYGLTESSPVASFNRPADRKIGSIGTPIEGVEMTIADGEILVRGHNVMKGYWNRPRETAEALTPDGWLRTGDLGRVDEDGAFFLTGRRSDLIIRDGHNIYPAEVESVLLRHPAVREAAALGTPDAIRGEEVLACVALAPGAYATEAQLGRHLETYLAGHKRPVHIWVVDALPKGPTGKVAKGEIVIPERIRLALARSRMAA